MQDDSTCVRPGCRPVCQQVQPADLEPTFSVKAELLHEAMI